jgi:hypothetical protein
MSELYDNIYHFAYTAVQGFKGKDAAPGGMRFCSNLLVFHKAYIGIPYHAMAMYTKVSLECF